MAGIPLLAVSNQSEQGLDRLREALSHGISAFSGNTGVGKSSLLNRLDPRLALATGETSQKLGLELYEVILKEELAECFPEFAEFTGDCRFTGCSHTVEKGCAVLEAVQEGRIHPSRHASYCALYEDAKKIREWELKR